MTDLQVLSMPTRRFWAMENRINAIKAEDQMQSLRISQASNSEEVGQEMAKNLTVVLDDVVLQNQKAILEPKRDKNAKERLLSLL